MGAFQSATRSTCAPRFFGLPGADAGSARSAGAFPRRIPRPITEWSGYAQACFRPLVGIGDARARAAVRRSTAILSDPFNN